VRALSWSVGLEEPVAFVAEQQREASDEFLLSVDCFDMSKPTHAQLVELTKERISFEIKYASLYGKEVSSLPGHGSYLMWWPRTPSDP